MLAKEDKRVLGEMSKQLQSYAQTFDEMRDFYQDAYDNLSETEQDHTEGEYLSNLMSDLDQAQSEIDNAIITIEALSK